jgi:hypothetical protein
LLGEYTDLMPEKTGVDGRQRSYWCGLFEDMRGLFEAGINGSAATDNSILGALFR